MTVNTFAFRNSDVSQGIFLAMLKIVKNHHLLVENLSDIAKEENKKFGAKAKSGATDLKKFLCNKNALGMDSLWLRGTIMYSHAQELFLQFCKSTFEHDYM